MVEIIPVQTNIRTFLNKSSQGIVGRAGNVGVNEYKVIISHNKLLEMQQQVV
jgi:hypothetical protein